MKTIAIFAAIIATASAMAVRAGPGGQLGGINIGLDAIAAAIGQGSAQANQQLLEVASGDSTKPAVLVSSNGILASVSQGNLIEQVAVANAADGTSSTINDGTSQQSAVAIDSLEAYLAGANLAAVQNSANTDTNGSGEIGSALNTHNSANQESSGWGSQ